MENAKKNRQTATNIAPALSPFLMPGTALAQSAKLGTADYGVPLVEGFDRARSA